MALIKCSECGKEISDKATTCPHCGAPVEQKGFEEEYHGMICPKCGSMSVLVQKAQTGNVGIAQNSVTIQEPKKKKGCLYWISCGWLLDITYWICVGWWLRLIFPKKKNKKGHNLSFNKTLNSTVATCQDCGHSWKI